MQNSLEIETGHWNKTICGEHTCICKLCSKDIGDEIGICCLYAKHAALRRKYKD
jgi:hypothetical protein